MVLGHEQVTEDNCRHNYGFLFTYKTFTEQYVYRCSVCRYEMNFSADEAGKIRDETWTDKIVAYVQKI